MWSFRLFKWKKLNQYACLFKQGIDEYKNKFIAYPLFNELDEMVGYEKILENKKGKFSSLGSGGGLRFGVFYQNADGWTDGAIVAEGAADALTGRMALELDAYSAISAHGIKKLANYLLQFYSYVIVLSDNDSNGLG